jgi:hypothetical protein
MTMPVASPGPDWPSAAFEGEARQLAVWLRNRRISALVGAPHSGRSTLLRNGVLPLLRRRAVDLARAPASRIVIPFPDRRRRGHGGSSEVAVFFDAWDGPAPLVRLLACIHEALGLDPPAPVGERLSLAGSLAALNMQTGGRFLLILDRFEQCLQTAPERDEARYLIDELVQALNRPLLPVHVLVCVTDDAGPLLAALFGRVPGNDEHALHLGEEPVRAPSAPGLWSVPGAAPVATALNAGAADAADPQSGPGHGPEPTPEPASAPARLSEAEWLASIGAVIARVADSARHEGRGEITLPLVMARPPDEPTPAGPGPLDARQELDLNLDLPHLADAPLAVPAHVPRAAPAPDSSRMLAPPIDAAAIPWYAWTGAAASAALAAYFVWPAPRPEPLPIPVAAAPARTPLVAPHVARLTAPIAAPAATPQPALVARADAGSARWRRELAATLGGAEANGPTVAWPPGFDPVPGQPQLAVARYDALQTARAAAPGLPLKIVTPVAIEALYFIVPVDSPRRFIHDIRGATFDIGPAGSARALTAETAYRRLFGSAAPMATRATAHDVTLLVDTPPVDWRAGLPEGVASASRVLTLDRSNPADQRALQTFLSARLQPAEGRAADSATLAEMSFLVTTDDAQGGRAAARLCRALPALRRDGAAVWRDLAPGRSLPTGWPMSAAARQAWRDCTAVPG